MGLLSSTTVGQVLAVLERETSSSSAGKPPAAWPGLGSGVRVRVRVRIRVRVSGQWEGLGLGLGLVVRARVRVRVRFGFEEAPCRLARVPGLSRARI